MEIKPTGTTSRSSACEDGLVHALLAQLASVPNDPAANVARAVAALEDCRGVDLALFPELFLSAYVLDVLPATAIAADGPELATVAAAAARAGTAVVIGFAERLPGGALANSAACIDEAGIIAAVYRKTRLFAGERAVFRAGGELRLVPLAGRLVGPLICFDVEFPELARTLAVAGAKLLVSISANMEPYGDEHEVATRARALENRLPHLYVNTVGALGGHRFVGRSRSVAADGGVLGGSSEAEELLVVRVGEPGASSAETDYLRQLPAPLPVVQEPIAARESAVAPS
jgi:predicted amidohydrolase